MPKPPLIDRAIGYVSPRWAASRAQYRAYAAALPEFGALYTGGSQSRIDTGWPTTIGYTGSNTPLNRYRLTKLRDRAREMDRNNAIASGMLDRTVENVVGRGFGLRATTANDDFNARCEDLWETNKDSLDLRGMSTWTQLQRMVLRSFLLDGDIGCGLVSRGSNANLQLFEGDLIDTQYGGYDLEQRIFEGIQYNAKWRPLAFHVVSINGLGLREEQPPIAASDFIFWARRKTNSQSRGEPALSQVFRLFDQVDAYIEAVIIAARIGACQSLMITKNNAGNAFGNLASATNSQGNQQKIRTIEPGSINYLQNGESVTGFNPTQPTHSFPDFVAALLRICGVTLGLPLELVLLDFSRTNYSSARASLLQAYRTFQTLQQEMISVFHSRVYRWRISKWVKDGTLEVPAAIRDSYWSHQWTPPGWAWIDPVKELQAAMMSVDAGMQTLSGIAHEQGREWMDLLTQRAKEIEKCKELGVPDIRSSLTRDAGANVAAANQPTPGQTTEEDEDEESDASDTGD